MNASSVRMEWAAFIGALALVAAMTAVTEVTKPPEQVSRLDHQRQMQQAELRQRFDQAIVMLHARQYDHAVTALERVLALAPNLPEAKVNMGFALLGLQRAQEARAFFLAAIDLRPQQANAYYGLAMAEEQRQDYEAALGGMRSYLHLAPADDAHRVRARAALWEWEEKLGRHAGRPPAPAPGK